MTNIKTLKTTAKFFIATLIMFNAASALSAERMRTQIAPSAHPLAKIIARVSPVGSTTIAGNGFVVGGNGCHVLTNFHVAFAKGLDAAGDIEWVTPIAPGHPVEIKVDLNADGTHMRTLEGRVVEYLNYDTDDMFGRSNDLAMIKLDDCLGKEYGIARFELPERTVHVPDTEISTLSLSSISPEKSALYIEKDCVAGSRSPIAGLFVHGCKSIPGMSGSPIFRNDTDGGFTIVGVTTGQIKPEGRPGLNYAIFSSIVTPFVRRVVGRN